MTEQIPFVSTPNGLIRERRKENIDLFMFDLRLRELENAFPDGPDKHREYHQAKIDAAREEAEFWKSAKMELTKIGITSIFGVAKIILTLAVLGGLYKLGLDGIAAKVMGMAAK